MVRTAVDTAVSDVHLMAQKDGYELAFRVDGDFCPQGVVPHEFGRRLISHVKANGGIDLAESRRPTEGRMVVPLSDGTVDLRVSTVPSAHGQDMVVRLFDHTVSLMELTELGLLDEQLDLIADMINRPHGLVLVSGPSGSGKTTTLYAILRHLTNRAARSSPSRTRSSTTFRASTRRRSARGSA